MCPFGPLYPRLRRPFSKGPHASGTTIFIHYKRKPLHNFRKRINEQSLYSHQASILSVEMTGRHRGTFDEPSEPSEPSEPLESYDSGLIEMRENPYFHQQNLSLVK